MVSRVAKYPVHLPAGVDVAIADATVVIKGKKGELKQSFGPLVTLAKVDNQLLVSINPASSSASGPAANRESNKLAGTLRALVSNMVRGVSEGFERKLVMVGVGYRAKTQGNILNISAGFSHPVDLDIPVGLVVETPSVTEMVIKGSDKQRVCQFAANIRAIRPPEPYKGKGIRYSDERVILKEAKKK